MGVLRYASHGDVVKDPAVPVPEWSLNDVGRRQAEALAAASWGPGVRRVVSSAEPKAMQMAGPFVAAHGLELDVRAATGEVDRSSTGYLPEARHTELANRLFAAPYESADGWERAADAQARVREALADVLGAGGPDVLVVGHGAVGTFLWCALNELAIARTLDQDGPGHVWAFDLDTRSPLHAWTAI